MSKPDMSTAQRRYAWSTTDEDGQEVRHFKTIDEHGVTIGEHVEGGVRGVRSWHRIISGRPLTMPSAVEETFGTLSLSIDCQEGRDRRNNF
jgi:hypothetical protein